MGTVVFGSLTIPVVGEIIALVGVVAAIVAAIIRNHELTPFQTWVQNYGVELIGSVKVPTPETEWIKWLSDHVVPGPPPSSRALGGAPSKQAGAALLASDELPELSDAVEVSPTKK